MKQISEDQIKLLKTPLPAEAVKPHPTKTFLSSIKAIYVVERLNAVFGIGSWHLRSEVIDNKTAMIVVKSVLSVPEYGIELESYGGNDNGGENSKNHDTGDAYKGAVTDAFTKICSYLEIGIDVFKGKQNTGRESQAKPVTSYNHKPIEKNGLPLLTNEQYKKACTRIKDGEIDVYHKVKAEFSLDTAQEQLLRTLYDNAKKQPA
jgi:hypothetical protein